MTFGRTRYTAPRLPDGTGAHTRRLRERSVPVCAAAVLGMALLPLLLIPAGAVAQDPPDSVLIVPDSLPPPGQVADTLIDSISADTIFYNLPAVTSGVVSGYATGVWEWDRHAIMAMGANTLMEILQEVPGLITLLGGDYGTPASMSAFGQGGAGYRVIRDGFELYPVDGGVADLQRIGLAGIGRVRLDRSLGQMIITLTSHRYDDGRPFSVIEAGTGDLDTNMFRGVFSDPTALFGSIGAGLERIDTRGREVDRTEAGSRTGGWARYQFHLRDRAAIGVDFRRVSTQTRVLDYVPEVSRTDVMVRAGWQIATGLTLEGYSGRSSLVSENDTTGLRATGVQYQHGGTLGLSVGGAWLNGTGRVFDGDLPGHSIDLTGGIGSAHWGGVSGRWSRSNWDGVGTSSVGLRAWASPVPWFTAFGAFESGDFGARSGALVQNVEALDSLSTEVPVVPSVDAMITDRETLRAGGMFSGWGVTLAGAALYAYSDQALPLATELDRGAPAVPGVHRNGFEAFGVVPTSWEGLTLRGSYQWWDEPGPYLPEQVYRASFEFHRVYKESENLEFWASFGVRGHDPMQVFVANDGSGTGGLVVVPFYQSWYARIQVRVVTVRLWLGMDNLTFRRNLQNYPDRVLPYARSFFALRWDMWN